MAGGSGSDPAAQMRERLQLISAQAKHTNEGRVRELSAAIDRLSAGTGTDDERAEAVDVAHKLAGSAGTFGYGGVSETARELESWLASGGVVGTEQPAGWIADLKAGLAADPDDPDD